jgi:hypothetical protein
MSPGPLTLAPEIDELRRQFEAISAKADTLVAPLRDDQFAWRPTPDGWSVAECLDHLNATARVYLPKLDEGIADAIRRGQYGTGPFKHDWVGRVFVRLAEPPSPIRMKAPPPYSPAPNRSRHEVMAAFRAYQVQFIDRLRQANGLDLARARVTSPVSRWIRFSLGAGFQVMAAHERRHLWQARMVIEAVGFPASSIATPSAT